MAELVIGIGGIRMVLLVKKTVVFGDDPLGLHQRLAKLLADPGFSMTRRRHDHKRRSCRSGPLGCSNEVADYAFPGDLKRSVDGVCPRDGTVVRSKIGLTPQLIRCSRLVAQPHRAGESHEMGRHVDGGPLGVGVALGTDFESNAMEQELLCRLVRSKLASGAANSIANRSLNVSMSALADSPLRTNARALGASGPWPHSQTAFASNLNRTVRIPVANGPGSGSAGLRIRVRRESVGGWSRRSTLKVDGRSGVAIIRSCLPHAASMSRRSCR